ncbi:Alpha/beta hydrolase family [Gaiella occulta]|uniref:Alpha/beta hydrolase family n=1 Tax=Gaiella occulta TaxID=1002870 RepID=A0A7M2YV66_9ACTN|nr:alpha/beta hydrolase [Gaiella occulta]RDI73620.1 Alpha/beta hydrolase family [Gaiella occulta]
MIEAVEITTRDGFVLRGEVAVRASDWIVLVHAPGEDIDAWRPLSTLLEEHQLTVLAVDLRGHGGSDGEPDTAMAATDVEAMLYYARSHMALRVFLAAAAASAVPVLDIADRSPVEGLVLVSPLGVQDTGETPVPRLVLHDPEDAEQEASAARLAEAPGWSLGISLPAAGRSCGMVQGEWGENVTGYVIAFLRDVRLNHPDRLPPDSD